MCCKGISVFQYNIFMEIHYFPFPLLKSLTLKAFVSKMFPVSLRTLYLSVGTNIVGVKVTDYTKQFFKLLREDNLFKIVFTIFS